MKQRKNTNQRTTFASFFFPLTFGADQRSILQEFQKTQRRLFAYISVCLVLVSSMTTFASGLGPGLQSDPSLATMNFVAVLSPVVPLVIMKAEPEWLHFLWPPLENLFEVHVHLPWMAGIFAITMSNLLMVGFMAVVKHIDLVMLALLPERRVEKARLREYMQRPDPIYGLLLATHVLSSIFATLHLPTLLRSLKRADVSELVNLQAWSRLGAIVIFIATGDVIWLAIYGSPWCLYIIQLWSICFLFLCKRLGASPFAFAVAALCPVQRVRTLFRLTLLRDSLNSGDMTFTNRPTEPLLAAEA